MTSFQQILPSKFSFEVDILNKYYKILLNIIFFLWIHKKMCSAIYLRKIKRVVIFQSFLHEYSFLTIFWAKQIECHNLIQNFMFVESSSNLNVII